MKTRTIVVAGSYASVSGFVLGLGIAAAALVIALGNLIEGACCCIASERQS